VRDAQLLLHEGPEALRSLALPETLARTEMVAERRSLSDSQAGWWATQTVERSPCSCPLQQHGLRMAHANSLHAREESGPAVCRHRCRSEREEGRSAASWDGKMDGAPRSQGLHVIGARELGQGSFAIRG